MCDARRAVAEAVALAKGGSWLRRFVGCVILESLSDETALSGHRPIAERVVEMPADPDAATWHLRWYFLAESDLRQCLPGLAAAMRHHWYAHFWADDDLCVVLAGRVFWVKASDISTWQEFIRYGDAVGVERKWTERIPTEIPDAVRDAWASADEGGN